MSECKIKRALISVYDKTGIADFTRTLVDEFGIEIISTGGTATLLKESSIPVTLVEDVTGFPEMMDGRVKTLHPKIHAGILADRDNPDHMRQLEEQGIKPIDMVVVNLYPFEKTVADPDCTLEQAIEMIDIGGPCLLRAAAKNHKHVLAVSNSDSYSYALENLRSSGVSGLTANYLLDRARNAFGETADYDTEVSEWLSERLAEFPFLRVLRTLDWGEIRYGENPHQEASLLQTESDEDSGSLVFTSHDSDGSNAIEDAQDDLSFNNYVDGDAALGLCRELTRTLTVGGENGIAGTEVAAASSVGPTFQSVFPQVTEEQHTRRHLPHIQNPGAHYFVTFRLRAGTLCPEERDIVFDACKYWHSQKMTVHACVVMPDHAHLLITPHETAPGSWVPLGDITRSIKGFSARRINQRRGASGSIWLDESWDRIVRNEKEYGERWEYIEGNPAKAGLGDEYRWLWLNHSAWKELADYNRLVGQSRSPREDRLESRSHRPLKAPSLLADAVVTFIKHTNACGTGIASPANGSNQARQKSQLEAYRQAYLGDPNAAMGGILACNFTVTDEFATAVMETYSRWGKDAGAGGFFAEVWIAPTFEKQAVETIRTKKKWGERVRLLAVGDMCLSTDREELDYKKIAGGMLVQDKDTLGLNEDQWKVVTKREPTESELADLRLSWLVCKHTKSNAITICKDQMLIGNGAGRCRA